ncbi:MAG: DUF692 domain-containing protein [Fibrobacteria bacterium]
MPAKLPHLGFGLGLRIPHYPHIFAEQPAVDFFEIISENFMAAGGIPSYNLDRILETYRVVMHGVCLSLGAPGGLDMDYLKKLKALARRTQAPWFSDHLCWTKAGAHHYHDLLPLPYTEEAVEHVAAKARIAQDYLELPLGIENLSAVAEFSAGSMPEWEFYRAVVERADCRMLLDVNNIYVSSRNHHFDALEYLRGLDLSRVCQIHLAGHSDRGSYVLDTHDHPVRDEVWEIFAAAYAGCGGAATMVEWDAEIPSFPVVWGEVLKAKSLVSGAGDAGSGLKASSAPVS